MASIDNEGAIVIQNISDFSTPIQMGRVLDQNPIHHIVLSGDAKILASIDNTGKVSLWDIENPSNPTSISLTHLVNGYPVRFSPDGSILATMIEENNSDKFVLWNITERNSPNQYNLPTNGWPLAFSPDGKILASSIDALTPDSKIILWDVSTPSLPVQLGEPIVGSELIAFSPNGKIIAANTGSIIRIWDISDPTPRILSAFLSGHTNHLITNLCFSPDGKILVQQQIRV